MKKTLLVLASALFGMSVGLSVYAADQAPAAEILRFSVI